MRKQVKRVFACLLALVMIASIMPVTSDAASKKASVVTNQKQLKQALKSGKKDIQIKTPKKVKLTIPALKQAKSVSITIDAKNATVTNKAGLKSVAIKDVNAFVESGKKNEIRISDKKLSLTVAKQSTGAKIKVVAKSDLTVLGTTKEAIRITIMAKNTTITAKAKVDATLNADATLNLATGAEGSKITTAQNITANVVNNTKGLVVMKDSAGITTNIAAGKTETMTDKYPKVNFSKTDDVLTGNVSFERNELLLTVEFYSDEQVIDKNGKQLDDWTVDTGLYREASDKFCLDKDLEFLGENDEKITAVFEIFEDTVGKHSMQFDYEVYADDAETQFLGKKTITVNYEIKQEDLDKLNASYVGKIMATGRNTVLADFSSANQSGIADALYIKKQGGGQEQWVDIKNSYYDEDALSKYDVELEKDLESGTYIVLASYSGTQSAQYLGKFTYDSSAWTNLDAAKKIVEDALENMDILDNSFDVNAAKTELENKIKSCVNDDQIQIEVKRWLGEEEDDAYVQVDIRKGQSMYQVLQSDCG